MAITFPGLGSGLDINGMIENIMMPKTEKLQNYKKKEQTIKKQEDVFGTLRKAMEKLQQTSKDLSTIDALLIKKATSSNTSVAGIGITGENAIDGTYVVDVQQMATASTVSFKPNPPITAPDQVINNTGSVKEFTYELNGEQRTVQLKDGATITDLVNGINKDAGNAGVRASILKDGNEYVFRLQSTETGAKNTISIVDSPNSLPGWETTGTGWSTQSGQDALYRIDGYPSTGWITSSSNAISDAIPGVTVNLQGIGTSAISVSTSSEKIVEKVEEFVKNTNEVLAILNDINTPGKPSEGTAKKENDSKDDYTSIFYNNNFVNSIQKKLDGILSSRLPGYNLYDTSTTPPTGDRFSSLGNLGIKIDSNKTSDTYGQLIIDKDKLTKAVEEDPKGVANLISADGIGKVSSPDNSFYFQGSINGITKAGEYEIAYDIDASGNVINATIGGEPASWDPKTNTLAVSTGDPKGIALKITDFTEKSYTGSVSIQDGIATTLGKNLEEMFLPNGDMLRLSETVKKDLDGMKKDITSEEKRLKEYEENLRARFTRMDLKIAQMNSQLSVLAGFIGAGA